MTKEHFYFLTDDYYNKYSQYGIMNTKEFVNGTETGRPFFFAIQDDEDADIFWMVPISSKYNKYQQVLAKKLQKYKDYDGLEFGKVQGRDAAFLLQNICPVKKEFVIEEYIDKTTGKAVLVQNSGVLKKILMKARKLISLTKKGIRCTQTNALEIYKDIK